MADLPDISDLLELRDELYQLSERFRDEQTKTLNLFEKTQQAIIKCYQAAGVTKEECDHPVSSYHGMGNSNCDYCGEPID